jgi:hypothetical protein
MFRIKVPVTGSRGTEDDKSIITAIRDMEGSDIPASRFVRGNTKE